MSDYAARTALGTHSAYPRAYNPDLLQGIERADYRKALAQPARDSAFAAQAEGFDRWHCLEVSWLNAKGKPCFAQGSFSVPSASPRIVESKSVKLYLASLNQHRFENAHALESAVSQDIGKVCGSDVHFKLAGSEQGDAASPGKETGALTNAQSIDAIDVACSQYQRDPNLLQQGAGNVEKEILTTQLLRSNCPVTGQPDWAELSICYSGRQLEAASLLQYVASFREHSGFHEHTLEQVYLDLAGLPGIDALATLARYTRRGGVAISAYRASPGFRNGLQDIALLRAAIQ